MRTRWLFVVALGALVLAGAPVLAEPTAAELAQARERFVAARKHEEAGQWTEALALFQRVAEVRATPQVRFHIGLCQENLGLWTQALDSYAQAEVEAASAAPEVVAEAREHIRTLSAIMPTVSLVVTGAQPGDVVFLDRRRVTWDGEPLPIRVDPGPHTAEVERAGVVIAREQFAVQKQTTRRVELRLGATPLPPPTTSASAATPLASASAPPPPPTQTAAPHLPTPSDGRAQRVVGWSAIGTGGLSLILTGVFVGLRAGALHRLEGACPTFTNCQQSVSSIVGEGKTYAALVNVFGLASLVTVGGGSALLLTAPRLTVSPTPGGAALVAEGAF